jgi:hypothetical protein
MAVSTSENRRKPQSLKVGNKTSEGVNNFIYLGNIIDNENRINKCVRERTQAGNKAYFANNKLFRNKFISRSTKMQIYRTIFRPVVTYGSETWTLPTAEENALRIFERKILRKMYRPVMENGVWRNPYNDELNEIIKGEDIVRFIKAQRIRWVGHVERMEESATTKKMLKGKLFYGRRRGRPRKRWLDDVMGIKGWRKMTRKKEVGRLIVEEAKAHPGL